ncbi:MAG: YihY/virulence factor BrkB family protein [Methanosarcinaceae archaeon]|nr:YihY/virulence factor BrkB family protein [Methanosarcinaceae archaeon]
MNRIKAISMETYRRWNEYDGMTDSAALAFIFLLSLPALILFTVSLGSLFLQHQVLRNRIISYIPAIADQTGIDLLNKLFQQLPATGTITFGLVISSVLFMWIAANLFRQLQKTINGMWDITYHHRTWYEEVIRKRLVTLVAVLVFVLLVMITTAFEIIFFRISSDLNSFLPLSVDVIRYSSSIFNFILLVMLFTYLYRVLPQIRLNMKYVLTGSFLTVVFITIGKYAFSVYIRYSDPTSIYGSIGSMIAIFLWVYISAIIVTFMIQFTKVYADIDNNLSFKETRR